MKIGGGREGGWHRAVSVVTRRREIKSLAAFFKTESDAVWKLSKDECTQYLEHVYVYPRDSPAIGETSKENPLPPTIYSALLVHVQEC